jgi:rare lipoprotein A
MLVVLALAGCASRVSRDGNTQPSGAARPGGYYLDDGPGANPPANLEQIPDAVPRLEPLHRFANRPYSVFGREYVPATELRPYHERGIASWYGRKFHGVSTSTGEPYDMYAMTAAHPTLPLPSYAKVTHVGTGRSVIVRVNDRGPFLHGRVIDLSYAAASRLGFLREGSAEVEVDAILPEGVGLMAAQRMPPRESAQPVRGRAPDLATARFGDEARLRAPLPAVLPQLEAPPLSIRIDDTRFWLQLAAFTALDNAENFLTLMQFQISGSEYSRDENAYTPRIRTRDNLFRVEIGPYASKADAERAAADLEARFGVVPIANPR